MANMIRSYRDPTYTIVTYNTLSDVFTACGTSGKSIRSFQRSVEPPSSSTTTYTLNYSNYPTIKFWKVLTDGVYDVYYYTTAEFVKLSTNNNGAYYECFSGNTNLVDASGLTWWDMSDETYSKYNSFMFYESTLSTISLPLAHVIREYAFSLCKNLSTVLLPNVSDIGSDAFNGSTLITIDAPNVLNVQSRAFSSCNLTSVSMPKATQIGSGAFLSCKSITSISLPSVTSMGEKVCYQCTALTSISLPSVTLIGQYTFYQCWSLTSVSVPNAKTIDYYAFYHCESLTSLSLPNVTSMGVDVFYNCPKLTAIHFASANKSAITALSGYSSKFGATNATIYFDL